MVEHPQGFIEDAALRAVYALGEVPPDQIDVHMVMAARNLLNITLSKAMEAQNKVAAE